MSTAEILQLWECSRRDSLTDAAAAMLRCVEPGCDALPVGARDQALLHLRERIFGRRLVLCAACPACSEPLELETTTTALRVDSGGAPRFELERGDLQLALRLPCGEDVAEATAAPDPHAELLRRCVVDARRGDRACALGELDPDTWAAIAAEIAARDPAADLRFALSCPTCGHDWSAPFDIVAVLRAELSTLAMHTLRDVHTLARAYGWREADILALSPLRRRIYLDLVGT